ncbi:uncharacterized protein BDR25DRAFT_309901 [Lindgomyces ingoldianus]|uniref:Uncharacterized protein n=1 Tax=Lindgomyces ingoldianus TaxID=673940 RepID=A0ACB6RB18_9PLEO|nr:uncharacterized protein BDR25DRAFT_309901 [Lindgomyces ingoldianus]KAF2476523.1 hypothetical protein BDR25DRAFT_309901 [Lindgomyces ingoldianus]
MSAATVVGEACIFGCRASDCRHRYTIGVATGIILGLSYSNFQGLGYQRKSRNGRGICHLRGGFNLDIDIPQVILITVRTSGVVRNHSQQESVNRQAQGMSQIGNGSSAVISTIDKGKIEEVCFRDVDPLTSSEESTMAAFGVLSWLFLFLVVIYRMLFLVVDMKHKDMTRASGGKFLDGQWTFGQIVSAAVFMPLLVELLYLRRHKRLYLVGLYGSGVWNAYTFEGHVKIRDYVERESEEKHMGTGLDGGA